MNQSRRTPCPDCGRKYITRIVDDDYGYKHRRLIPNCIDCDRCEHCSPSTLYGDNWRCDDCAGSMAMEDYQGTEPWPPHPQPPIHQPGYIA